MVAWTLIEGANDTEVASEYVSDIYDLGCYVCGALLHVSLRLRPVKCFMHMQRERYPLKNLFFYMPCRVALLLCFIPWFLK